MIVYFCLWFLGLCLVVDWLIVVDFDELIVDCWLMVVGRWSVFVVCRSWFVDRRLPLLVVCWLLINFVVRCLLFGVWCLLLVDVRCCSLVVGGCCLVVDCSALRAASLLFVVCS